MIIARLAAKVLKHLLPMVLDHMMQIFKLDKVLRYVEEDNELDHKVKELETRNNVLDHRVKELENRIKKLEK